MNTNKKQLLIAFSDDWELKGNGEGNVKKLQYENAIKLMDIYETAGIKSSFNVEVLQQIAFEKFSNQYEEIKEQKNYWLKAVDIMHERGFDIQLHIHPQWHNAFYNGTNWILDKRWSIPDYPEEYIDNFFNNSIKYLKINCGYVKPVVFRACEWGLYPSSPLLKIMEKYGIQIDTSIVNGIYFENENIKLDYTNLESPYLPYYPDYEDARKVSESKTKIIEIPTQSFFRDFKFKIRKAIKKPFFVFKDFSNLRKRNIKNKISLEKNNKAKNLSKHLAVNHSTIDVTCLDSFSLINGFNIAINRALAEEEWDFIPLIFVSHTKNLDDKKGKNILNLILYLKKRYKNKIRFVTLRDLVENINVIKKFLDK